MGEVTQLLDRARQGEGDALADLFRLVYPDLRRLAHARLGAHQRNTLLDTTALVHECFLKLCAVGTLQPTDRAYFFAYAARTMRSIIIDLARASLAERRGGQYAKTTLDTAVIDEAKAEGEVQLLALHDALEELASLDVRMAKVVELRYFVGLTEPEIGEILGVTDRTVRRDWEKARLLLAAALGQ
ncbi:MAG: sigma-70 family RNA polymerase sigma factor [Gammaproteobacteria bacterium]|nr:sigma-70 family RNA polymerase sigma factor [Gammaproteobacteria bacterium]